MLESITKDISFRRSVQNYGAAAPNKGTTILYWFRPPKNSVESSCKWENSRTFQGLWVFFKYYTGTFQACANPVTTCTLNMIIYFIYLAERL